VWEHGILCSPCLKKWGDTSPVSPTKLRSWPSTGMGPGPGKVGQRSLKALHLQRHSKKIRNPKPKKMFYYKWEDLPSLKHLNSSLVLSAQELCPRKDTCEQPVFVWTTWINLAANVLSVVVSCNNSSETYTCYFLQIWKSYWKERVLKTCKHKIC